MTTEFILVRHGETASNTRGLLHGRTDVPLNQNGMLQALRVAERLRALEHVAGLHSSPLARARATAEAIGHELGLQPTIHADLAELDFGELEGLDVRDLARAHPELARRLQDPTDLDAAFPGGESRRQFHARVRASIDRPAGLHQGERIVVVAHGGVIASAVAQLTGGEPNDWERYMVRNCSVTHLTMGGDAVSLECWDDVTHLDVAVGSVR